MSTDNVAAAALPPLGFLPRFGRSLREVRTKARLALHATRQIVILVGVWLRERLTRHFAALLAFAAAALFVRFADKPAFFENASSIHLACAGIIGTALTLVLTISIVPAQRAADAFSSAILWIYLKDRRLLAIWISLSALAVGSLVLATGFPATIDPRFALAAEFVALGLTLDALRGFYVRALQLMVPTTALRLVEIECRKNISAVSREVEMLTSIVADGENDGTAARWLLHTRSQLSAQLVGWTSQVEEFAHKAIARRDTQGAREAVATITSIAGQYVSSRRRSLVLVPDPTGPLLMGRSDLEGLLHPAYESLSRILDAAVGEKSELVTCSCVSAFGAAATHALTAAHAPSRSAPLAYAPTFYMKRCIPKLSAANMDDALLAVVRACGGFLGGMTDDVYAREAEGEALNCLFDVAVSGYRGPHTVVNYSAVGAMLAAMDRELTVRGFDRVSLFTDALSKLVALLPAEAAMERAGHRQFLSTFPAYDALFNRNLPHLLEALAQRAAAAPDDLRVLHNFLGAAEELVSHYRDVARDVLFQGGMLQAAVVTSAIACAEAHVDLLSSTNGRTKTQVRESLLLMIAASSWFFREADNFPSHHAAEAAGGTAVLGMRLMWGREIEPASKCAEAIMRIGEKCASASDRIFATVDILLNMEVLARAADALGMADFAVQLRSYLERPAQISDADLAEYADALDTRLRQLDERLSRHPRLLRRPSDSAACLLELLEEVRSAQG